MDDALLGLHINHPNNQIGLFGKAFELGLAVALVPLCTSKCTRVCTQICTYKAMKINMLSGAFAAMCEQVRTSLYIKLVLTGLYIRICMHEPVRTSLYIQICTYRPAHTSLYVQICTDEPVHTNLYVQACTQGSIHTNLYLRSGNPNLKAFPKPLILLFSL